MKNFHFLIKKDFFSISLILILAFSRIIPHPPNFTPIITIAVMSGYLFRNIYLAIAMLLISMLLSDAFIGFYKNMFFVYISLIFIVYFFYKIDSKINFKNLFLFSIFGSVIFYLISNFGVWYFGGLYEKNFNGLIECYFLAIPFFKNTLISTIIFSYAAFFTNSLHIKSYKNKT